MSLCAASAALATTYVRVEKDGSKTYSDRPLPGGQPIDLQPAQTYSTPPPGVSAESQQPREEQLLRELEDFRYQSCTVTPENDTTFQNPESVNIAVSINPSLRPGDVVTMTVDGQPAGPPNSLTYTMSPVYRGTHTVGLSVANPKGKVVCNSTSVFHVQQPGMNSPARQAPPRPRPPPPRPTPH
ncbi:MAG TPA: DUF4124 domain-containing protein [Steroidobacteraceae bacterium]|nr:DUF4124 domain-containing protein [Steroidobacteraceae bacterium]